MPLLSIVIPSHNRGQYARYCIESILAIGSSDIELVVTDTSTDNNLANYLNGEGRELLDDPRLVYAQIAGPSNLTKNHNDAVALATGDYVCVIGDDDCITSAAIDAARWASANRVPVVSQTVTANYAWPDFRSLLARRGHAARLYVPRRAGAGQWRQSENDLEAGLGRALQGTDALPRCYHGVVRRDLLETIRERTGAYFHGSSPDMSGAVSLACLIDRYVEVDVPLTIPGASGGSNSGRSAMNTHKGALNAESQTSSFLAEGWTAGVPRFFSVETVWAHAGLSAIGKLKPDLVASFNYPLLLALCSLRHPDYADAINGAAREAEMLSGQEVWPQIRRHMKREKWARRKYLLRRAMRPTAANGRRYFGKLPTIASASRRYDEYARSSGFSFHETVDGL